MVAKFGTCGTFVDDFNAAISIAENFPKSSQTSPMLQKLRETNLSPEIQISSQQLRQLRESLLSQLRSSGDKMNVIFAEIFRTISIFRLLRLADLSLDRNLPYKTLQGETKYRTHFSDASRHFSRVAESFRNDLKFAHILKAIPRDLLDYSTFVHMKKLCEKSKISTDCASDTFKLWIAIFISAAVDDFNIGIPETWLPDLNHAYDRLVKVAKMCRNNFPKKNFQNLLQAFYSATEIPPTDDKTYVNRFSEYLTRLATNIHESVSEENLNC